MCSGILPLQYTIKVKRVPTEPADVTQGMGDIADVDHVSVRIMQTNLSA